MLFKLAENGKGKFNGTHDHPLYDRWNHLFGRCYRDGTKAYSEYGARGIRVCERWKDFSLFLEDMGPPPTSKHVLDRIDPSLHYTPDNVRWVTPSENNRNIRGYGKSKYKGVKQNGRGFAVTLVNTKNQRIHLGTYDTELEAAEIYNRACLFFEIEYARLNKIER